MSVEVRGADRISNKTVSDFDQQLLTRMVSTGCKVNPVEPDQPALAEIVATFGDNILDDDGALDRAALRSIVFADDAKRRQPEAILHPRIRTESTRQAALATSPYHIVVVPLLAESPMRAEMDRILVVDCDEATQLRRLMARDGSDEAEARRMIAAQASRAERLAIADDVIGNDGDLDATRALVERLHASYLSLAGDRPA